MSAKISVIIPVYNVEKYLRQCLDSVINQTYKNLEIIIIDDGSPDGCGEICDEYSQKDNRIQVIHKKNGGLSAARNDAIKMVTGEWISFVDADDYCELDLYEKVLPIAEKNNVDIALYGLYKNVFERDFVIHAFSKEFISDNRQFIAALQASALNGQFTPQSKSKWSQGFPWDKLFKASLILNNKLKFATNVKANEDVIFDIHAFQYAKKILYIDRPLYHYRFNPNSIGNKYTSDRVQIDLDIYHELFAIGEKYNLSDDYYDALNARIIMNTALCACRCFFHKKREGTLIHKLIYASDILKKEPIYSAFENADRRKLNLTGKFLTIKRHHNVFLLYIYSKVRPFLFRIKYLWR